MRHFVAKMLRDLEESVSLDGFHGDLSAGNWAITWRFGERRIDDRARENVFTIRDVHIVMPHRGRGYFTELLRHLDEKPRLGELSFDWIYIEQCHFRLAAHLERELLYKSEFGMVIDCWRRVTGQLEMKL